MDLRLTVFLGLWRDSSSPILKNGIPIPTDTMEKIDHEKNA
jgi:hypothetical protein